jgi:hypothetical protein
MKEKPASPVLSNWPMIMSWIESLTPLAPSFRVIVFVSQDTRNPPPEVPEATSPKWAITEVLTELPTTSYESIETVDAFAFIKISIDDMPMKLFIVVFILLLLPE